MEVFSLPAMPSAVSYEVEYSDPSGDTNAPNPFGGWTALTGSPFTVPSMIVDTDASTQFRLYRARVTISVTPGNSSTPVSLTGRWSSAFSASQTLYDTAITMDLLPYFRSYLGETGDPQVASTSIDNDTGAGVGLLQFDGTRTVFNLADIPDADAAKLIEGLVTVKQNGTTKLENTDYVVNYQAGQVIFAAAPGEDDTCDITFYQSPYTNRDLNGILRASIDTLSHLGITSYNVMPDNNVITLPTTLPDDGIKAFVCALGLKVIHRSLVTSKGREGRAYKMSDFSIDTAPSRIVEALTAQSTQDWTELKAAANNYIRSATVPIVRSVYDSFFDFSGIIPLWNFMVGYGGAAWWI